MSSSIKERIKINKRLTQSTKTGNLMGVNPNRRNKMEGFTRPSELDLMQGEATQAQAVLQTINNPL